jgi:hypothetical protein
MGAIVGRAAAGALAHLTRVYTMPSVHGDRALGAFEGRTLVWVVFSRKRTSNDLWGAAWHWAFAKSPLMVSNVA